MSDFPVVMKATVGYASEEENGVRRIDVDKNYQHLNLVGVSFGETIPVDFIEDPDHPGFAKPV